MKENVSGCFFLNTVYITLSQKCFKRETAAILQNFEWPYLRKGSCYPFHVKIL